MNLLELDITILRSVNQFFILSMNLFFIIITYLVYVYFFFLSCFYFKRKQKTKMFLVIFSFIFGIMFVSFLKNLIARPRPYEVYPDINVVLFKKDFSFPSGQVFLSFMCFYLLPKELPKFLKFLSIVHLLLLIPLGSVYIGVHYPSDVLAGAVIGFLFPKLVSEEIIDKLLSKRF